MRKTLVIAFFIVLFSQGILTEIGVSPLVIDLSLFCIPFLVLLKTNVRIKLPPGGGLVFIYTLWSIIAAVYHGETVLRAILFSRYLLLGYLVFVTMYNSRFNVSQLHLINKVIFVMFFLQIVASLYEIVFNEIEERTVGIMFSGGGGPATTFPIFAFVFMFSIFLFRNEIIYLFAGFLFLIVGIGSGKLGIYILMPIIAAIGLLMFKFDESRLFNFRRFVKTILGIVLLIFLIGLILPKADPRTKRYNLSELRLTERLDFFIDYAGKGEKRSKEAKYTSSRSATSLRVIRETFSRPPNVFFLGQGFKAYQDINHSFGKGAFEEYGIVYGITGWTYDVLSYGWPLMFIHVAFFILIFGKVNEIRKNYELTDDWRIVAFAVSLNFFTFLLNYFFYNNHYTIGGWMICTHLYIAAIILSPNYKEIIYR